MRLKLKKYSSAFFGLFAFVLISLLASRQSMSADLIFGQSGEYPNCVGPISKTEEYAQYVYNVKAIKSRSTSLTPDYSFIQLVWPKLISQATYAAISNQNENLSVVYKQLYMLAKNRVGLQTIEKKDAEICYVKGPDQPCNYRDYEMAFQLFSYYAYVANLIKPYIESQPDKKIIQDYLRSGYQKYIRTRINPSEEGFSGLLSGYIGVYNYAKYFDDQNLMKTTIRNGISRIKSQLKTDGTINFSSYRGVRSYYYHTLAVNVILAFGELAEANGENFFENPSIKPKLKKAIELEIEYADDPKSFEKKGFQPSSDGVKIFSTREEDARRKFQEQALSTLIIIKKRYPDLIKTKEQESIFPNFDYMGYTDMSTGFVPHCLASAGFNLKEKPDFNIQSVNDETICAFALNTSKTEYDVTDSRQRYVKAAKEKGLTIEACNKLLRE